MGERYVVVRRAAGLGDILLTTMAAWAYAAATGRRLVIDWRFTQYTTDPTENLFPLVFEPLDEWGGLGVDHEVPGGVRTASSWYPQGWSAARLDAPPSDDALAGRASSRFGLELIKHGGDVDADVVVFDACLADVAPAPTVARALLQELRLRPTVQSAIDRETTRWGSGPVIGLHVRHGNGGAIMGHARWWTDPAVAIERIVAVVEEVRAAVGKWPVYLATDSRGAELMLRARIPGLIVRPKRHREPDAGELHRWQEAASTRDDAVVEMWLLSRVDVVRYPSVSYFSAIGALLKPPPPPHGLTRASGALEPGIW